MLRTRALIRSLFCLTAMALIQVSASAAEPLHAQIDKLIESKAGGAVNAPCTDAEFVRRIYLDVAGRVPSVDEARAFLNDKAADKRQKLIGKLFDSVEFPRRLEELLNQTLMERRVGDDAEWSKFLRWACDTNQPWDKIARTILDPNSEDEQTRGAAYFITNRLDKVGQQDTDYPGLTRDVARMFMGVDLQCAQCHNHLFIEDYKQVDFQGLYTVYLNTAIRRDVKFPAVQENLLAKKTDFQSVFEQVPMSVGPRVPGMKEVEIPQFAKGEEYLVAPDKKTKAPGVPKFSPLEAVAERMAIADNTAFNENLANRLWYWMMGRGIVHPLDLRHSANPASHPEVLQLLTKEVVARKYNMKDMLKELALSKTYQRSTVRKAGENPAEDRYRVGIEKPIWAEQLLWSTLTAIGEGAKDVNPREMKDVADLRKKFVTVFSNPAKEPEVDFSPSVRAALFLMNDSTVLGRLEPTGKNLVARLVAMKDAKQIADEVYLAVLTRAPTAEEYKDVEGFLAKVGVEGGKADDAKKAKGLGMLAWALLTSTEFCLNH